MTPLEEYNSFIHYRQQNQLPTGFEYHEHHIIPRSIGGPNRKWNRVKLTPEEHYKAHCILARIYKGQPEYGKILYGWHGCRYSYEMKNRPVNEEEFNEILKDYLIMIRARRLTASEKRVIGDTSRGRFHTEETKRRLSESHIGKPSPNKGRKLGPHSDEWKRKVSDSLKGKAFTDEHRRHISEGQRGKKRGPYKKKNSV